MVRTSEMLYRAKDSSIKYKSSESFQFILCKGSFMVISGRAALPIGDSFMVISGRASLPIGDSFMIISGGASLPIGDSFHGYQW